MEKKVKQKKTPLKESNPYKFYRNQYWGLKCGKWLSILAPFITIFAVKYNDYFVLVTESEHIKLSMGCILAMVIFGLTVWNESRRKGDGTPNKSPVNGVIGWGVSFALAYLLNAVVQDIVMILGSAFLGQLVALGFEFGAQNRYYYMESYKDLMMKEKMELTKMQRANRAAIGQLTGKHPPIN